MKYPIQNSPLVLSRSFLALGVGCALTALPFRAATAQESKKSSPPTTAGETSTDQNQGATDRLHTDSTVPKKKASEKVATELTNKEKQFVNKALAGNASEVMMAELALKKSESPEVKEFAEKMIADHKKANTELSEIEDAHGVSVPSPNPSDEDKAMYANMTSLTGTAFDAAYTKHAVTDHEMDVKEYKEAKKEVKDKMLAAYVDKTLTTIEGHLKMAQMLAKKAPAANH